MMLIESVRSISDARRVLIVSRVLESGVEVKENRRYKYREEKNSFIMVILSDSSQVSGRLEMSKHWVKSDKVERQGS